MMNITPISVADQLDRQAENVSQSAALMNASAGYLRRAGPVIRAARLCVLNPAWSGVCDEDVMLEKALRDGGGGYEPKIERPKAEIVSAPIQDADMESKGRMRLAVI